MDSTLELGSHRGDWGRMIETEKRSSQHVEVGREWEERGELGAQVATEMNE